MTIESLIKEHNASRSAVIWALAQAAMDANLSIRITHRVSAMENVAAMLCRATQYFTIEQIVRQTGHSRATVKEALTELEHVGRTAKPRRASKYDYPGVGAAPMIWRAELSHPLNARYVK